MKLIRIGEKLINRNKIEQKIDSMLDMRVQGFSQTEVAKVYATDRAFVSRLESLGEIRKGGKVAIVAFPISNAEEILQLANKEGIDFFRSLQRDRAMGICEKQDRGAAPQ